MDVRHSRGPITNSSGIKVFLERHALRRKSDRIVRTAGPSNDVWILLFIAFVGVPILIGHFGTAAYLWAGFLILAASVMRLHRKAGYAQHVANHLAGANAAQMLASRNYVLASMPTSTSTSTSTYNKLLQLAELSIVSHAAQLRARRRQLTTGANHGQDDSRWLQEVETFIDEVIEASVGPVRSSPECLRAVRWMIAGATAPDSHVWENAA